MKKLTTAFFALLLLPALTLAQGEMVSIAGLRAVAPPIDSAGGSPYNE